MSNIRSGGGHFVANGDVRRERKGREAQDEDRESTGKGGMSKRRII